ncbi:hypothetical protein [Galbibacter mesophilus]|uniref:hypothetical protein n=1 Tax=Galbibacter mesophilus TaxID=379069 RepID=UPI0019201275|nr:hypothetical protein [Galbibacter mesophilus]MCM5663773.1 hypothetical protein [Galbibacter mesophilus]
MKNVIETKLTPEIMQNILLKIKELEEATEGLLVALTEEERTKYGSINELNKLVVDKVYDHHKRNPELSSKDIDWTEFKSDREARVFYENAGARIKGIGYRMESTKILHDYDNYHDALLDYNHAKYKKEAGAPGYTEKVAEISQFFPRSAKQRFTSEEGN